jgi:transposase
MDAERLKVARVVLNEYRWDVFQAYLSEQGTYLTKNKLCHVEGIFWRIRTGSPWRDVPPEFGCWSSIYNLFNRWSKKGLLDGILRIAGFVPDNEWNCIDSTINRAHQHASGGPTGQDHAIGRSKGGLTTKVHMLSDALGNPVGFELTGGNAHDMTMADSLVEKSSADAMLGDKGYDSNPLREKLIESGIVPIIPMKSNSTRPNPNFDKEVYKARHVIENLFAKMKQYRGFATRFDKLKRNYSAVICLVCFLVWTQ